MEKSNVTVYDIAKEANVSPATVSRILTGNAAVSDEKRLRVKALIDKYDFKPNALARSLSKKESKTLGFILPDITNPFFSTVFLEAEKCALEAGYTMMLCDSMNNNDNESIHLKTLSEKQVDVIIIMGGRVNDVRTRTEYAEEMNKILKSTPILIVNGKMTGVKCHKIATDEEHGMIQLVEYLVSIGHSKIGLIGGRENVTSSYIKYRALEEAFRKNNLQLNKEWMIYGDYSIESGIESMKKLLKKREKPTALIAINDFVAIGAIRAANEAGLDIPKDMSITGFDDSYISEIAHPKLTTVNQNYKELGKEIINTVLDITSKKGGDTTKVIDTKLVVRDSCLSI
ncbi:LacI family DNA-binding transcriptional regulator [Clostridium oryzae]|uniref:Catabolite control protein A n=1 Tax=Clostridium oryzae TaxID=1450648 RepID=A0A1V4IZS0_9CLOT|nr:LacI family DNA-binding transcriptional regulator [Clostridium oryzae]OPJ65264.1 catabolite control protein A [Clostridium oryzae]